MDKKKVNIRLFEGDSDRLAMFYPNIPYNRVIRQLVRNHLDKLEAKMGPSLKDLPAPTEEKESGPDKGSN